MQIKTGLVLVGVLGAGIVAWQAKKKATELVTKTFNPVNDKNIVYTNTPQPIKNGLNRFWGALDSVGLLPR
jgi:hypothetical protein